MLVLCIGDVPRRVLLDRFEQHTSKCRACKTALERTALLLKVSQLAALALFTAAISSLVSFGVTAQTVGLVAATAAVAGVQWLAAAVMQQFLFVDYDRHHKSKLP